MYHKNFSIMDASPIIFGNCSKFYLYILGAFFFEFFSDLIISFKDIKSDSKINIFGFKTVLKDHKMIKFFYKYLGMMIFGILFFFIEKSKMSDGFKKKESFIPINGENKINKNAFKELLIIGIIFSSQAIIRKLLSILRFSKFDYWVFNIIFITIFMKFIFKINVYKHQKFSLIFIFMLNFSLLLWANLKNSHKDINDDSKKINGFEYINQVLGSPFYSILIYLVYILLSAGTSYSRVLSKQIMEHKYQSKYKIIYIIGIFGVVFILITLIFTSIFKCGGNIKKICPNEHFDSLTNYFSELKESFSDNKIPFFSEIFLINPLFLFVSFIQFTFEYHIIFYLNPNFILISDSLYFATQNLFQFIFDFGNIESDFYLNFIVEIITLLAYCIYLEIIEIRCFELNRNTRKSIMKRGSDITDSEDYMIEIGDYYINDYNMSDK